MRQLNLKPNTSFEAMRKKYKTMAMQQHPNKVAGRLRAQGGSTAAINAARAKATANFQKLEQAHSSATAHFTKYQSFRAPPPPGPQRPTTPPPQQAPPRAASAFGRMYGRAKPMFARAARGAFQGARGAFQGARGAFQGARGAFQGARPMFARAKPMFARAARAAFQGARSSFQGARSSFPRPMSSPDSRSTKVYLALSHALRTPNAHVPAIAPGMVAYVTYMSSEVVVMLYSQGRIAVVAHMALVNRRLGPIRVQRYGPAYANVSFLEQARVMFNRRY